MKVLIIDPIKKSREQLAKLLGASAQVQKVFAFEKSEQALDIALEHEIDLVFVDFVKPGMNGIGFLSELPYARPHIVVISSVAAVAKDAYELEAIDFLLKPVRNARVMKSLARVLKADERKQAKIHSYDNLFIKLDGNLKKVSRKEIYMIESSGDYLKVYTDSAEYTIYSTFKKVMEILSLKDFMRVHRSYIIRIDRITLFENNMVKVDDHLVPVAQTYKQALMDRLKVL